MNSTIKQYIIAITSIVILCGNSQMLSAQNLSDDMRLIENIYNQSNKLHIYLSINAYYPNDEGEEEVEKIYDLEYKTKGKKTWMKQGKIITLVDNTLMLSLDKAEKKIYYRKNEESPTASIQNFNWQFDSLKKTHPAVNFLGEEKGIKKYLLTGENQMVDKIGIWIKDKMPYKTIYYYNENMQGSGYRVEYDFKIFNLYPNYKTNEFDFARYVVNKGETIALAETYKQYQLIRLPIEN